MSIRQKIEAHQRDGARERFQGVALEGGDLPRMRPEDVLRGLLLSVVIAAIGIAVGYFTQQQIIGHRTSYYVLAAGLGVALTALAYYKIEIVMLVFMAVVWVAVGNSPDVATGVTTGTGKSVGLSQIGMAFLLFVWMLRTLAKQKFSFARLPINRLLVLYLAFCILSAFQGYMFWDPAVAKFWTGMGAPNGGRTPIPVVAFEIVVRFLSAAAFWLFANNLRDEAWVRRASWLLLLPGAIVFAIHFVPVHLPLNSYSVLLENVFACTLFAWLVEPRAPGVPARRGLRFWGWLLLAGVVYQMFRMNLSWVSGWFALFMGLYWVALLRSRRLFLVLAVVGVGLYFAGHAFLQATVVHKIQTSGDAYRFTMAQAALRYALMAPLGLGPGNWRPYNLYYGAGDKWGTSTFGFSHSFYSQSLAELGFGGLILAALFILAGVIMASRLYLRMPPGAPRTFVLGMTGMWVGICASSGVGDYLIPVYYNNAVNTMSTTIYAWIALGLTVANARLYGLVNDAKEKEHDVAPPPKDAAEYYPRQMGAEPTPSPLAPRTSHYPRRMGRDRDSG